MDRELYKRLKALEKIDKLKKEALELLKENKTAKKSKVSYKEDEIAYLEENFQTFADVYRLMLLKAGENID